MSSEPIDKPKKKSMTWLFFALMTVASWGVYGIFLHKGAIGMGDPENGRYKAFLWVGIAYFVTAVAAPIIPPPTTTTSTINPLFKGNISQVN